MKHVRNRYLFALDAILLSLSPLLLYALRFEGFDWPAQHWRAALVFIAASVPVRLAIFWAFGLYRRLWRYASIGELELIVVAGVTASVVAAVIGHAMLPGLGVIPRAVPMSVLFNSGILSIVLIAAPRLLMRVGGWRAAGHMLRSYDYRRTLIAGAGHAGQMIVRELRRNPELGLVPVGFVDDDIAKHGLKLAGLPVLGALSQTPQIIERHDVAELIIAMPRARGQMLRDLVRGALDAGVKARIMPALGDILSGKVSVSALREIEIHDLLRRETVTTNLDDVRALTNEKTVLVTGAGGSIGSELARQIGGLSPSTLVILDHAENPIFHIQRELADTYPGLRVVPVIADVRDRRRMFGVLQKHRPFSVFHAAAHKHVPLMEENPIEAVTNNVKGTQNLVDAAVAAEVEHFVLISTDKAVRPTSVMGASKRIAEHVVRQAAFQHRRHYGAVRFGNVLGSEGSVVPTFLRQIRAGGPVTVTHPEMRRFFMTIPEAVQLVLQAGALANGGEVFMLDMGELVKIDDLARDLIRLSGLEVGSDIAIEYTGMRPGEKLFEEMMLEHESSSPTKHPKVLRVHDDLPPHGRELINDLIAACMQDVTDEEIRHLIRRIVPDFRNDAGVAVMDDASSYADITPTTSPRTSGDGRRVSGGRVLPLRRSGATVLD